MSLIWSMAVHYFIVVHQHYKSIDNDKGRNYKRENHFPKSNVVGDANVYKEPS